MSALGFRCLANRDGVKRGLVIPGRAPFSGVHSTEREVRAAIVLARVFTPLCVTALASDGEGDAATWAACFISLGLEKVDMSACGLDDTGD